VLHGEFPSGFLVSVFVRFAGCDLCCRGCSEGMRRGLQTRRRCAGGGLVRLGGGDRI
jgi:organic radical activating enzyme